MQGWLTIGDAYVRPVYEGYAQVIVPEGAGYALYDRSVDAEPVLIGTAPTPRRAAELVPKGA